MAPDQCRHQEIILGINADVAEFCPATGFFDLLAVGTYQLDEATRERHGRLHLYSLAKNSSSSSSSSSSDQPGLPSLCLAATLDLPGIFDLQWTQLPSIQDRPCIGLALADGTLQLLAAATAAAAAPKVELQQLASCQAVSEGMAMSLDWKFKQQQQQQQEQQQQGAPPLAAVSSSSGSISILQVTPTSISPLLEWQGHELEAWMASWDRHQANVLYSGADDSSFKGWDIRCPAQTSSSSHASSASNAASPTQHTGAEPAAAAPLFSNRRAHGAGVCCISSHPRREHVLVTGSYDEAVRLWDVRMLQRPVETCQVSTGGGVWRLKWHPHHDTLLLAACMYNGFALVQADDSWSTLQVVEEYKGHDSIAYGADWYRGPRSHNRQDASGVHADDAQQQQQQQQEQQCAAAALDAAASVADLQLDKQQQQQPEQQRGQIDAGVLQEGRDIVATCSFYDRRLHLWSPGFTCT